MKVAVVGLWHLGSVTAGCLAAAGHHVIGIDEEATIAQLNEGVPPVAEPGLAELLSAGISAGKLHFTVDLRAAADCDVIWVTYDTPVNEDDRADVEFVLQRAGRAIRYAAADTLVVVSSQLPTGSMRRLEAIAHQQDALRTLRFAYIPENLRLGKAIDVFTKPDRFVVGIRNNSEKERITALLGPYGEHIVWMSIESAEMTKHALNAFLATSIAFMNEIANLCELAGADAVEVEHGLKTDVRIGPSAYLHPGGAFAGGTLARDIVFLKEMGGRTSFVPHVIDGVHRSNLEHKNWLRRKLETTLGTVNGTTIAILGLTYKPGTDTLRRSSAIETAQWVTGQGAHVKAYDPAVRLLPDELTGNILLCHSAEEALRDADAVLIATEWPQFRDLPAEALTAMKRRFVFDPGRFLEATLGRHERTQYFAIGKGTGTTK